MAPRPTSILLQRIRVQGLTRGSDVRVGAMTAPSDDGDDEGDQAEDEAKPTGRGHESYYESGPSANS